jgi:hypothetical protein
LPAIPAKAGIHAHGAVFMDPGFRRGDGVAFVSAGAVIATEAQQSHASCELGRRLLRRAARSSQ